MLLLLKLSQRFHIVGKDSGGIKSILASKEIDDFIDFFENLTEKESLYIAVNEHTGIFLDLLFPFYQFQKLDIFPVSAFALRKFAKQKFREDDPKSLWSQLEYVYDLCSQGFSRSIGGPRHYRLEDKLYGQWCFMNMGGSQSSSFYTLGARHVAYPYLEPFCFSRKHLIGVLAALGDVRWYASAKGDLATAVLKAHKWNYRDFIKDISNPYGKILSLSNQAVNAWYDEDVLSLMVSDYRKYGAEYIKDSTEPGYRLGDAFYRIFYKYLNDHPLTVALYKTTTKFLRFVIGVSRWAFENSERTQSVDSIISEFLDIKLPTNEEYEDFKELIKTISPDKLELDYGLEEERKIFNELLREFTGIIVEAVKEENTSDDS